MGIRQLEVDTRFLIDRSLENLGWRFEGAGKNVFLEQPRSEKEREKLKGKRPDYVLYSKENDNSPLIIIEAKKKGERIDTALEQGIRYAKDLEAPIVFATDGLFCKSHHTKFDKTLLLNGEEVDEFLREALALKYLNTWEVNTISPKVQYSRQELIKVFDEANNILRGDGLRAGIERFGEFANILFLKLISETEDIKKLRGEESKFDYVCHWDYIKNLKPSSRIEHINKIVYEKLNALYQTEIFTPLSIRDTDILKDIMDKIDPLTLTDVDSDVKGDAFEYFLRESTASGNDLGEYFTPRHIVKAMVKIANPQIGEKVYDPFCGTGGFLIESFRHIWNTMPRNEFTNKILRKNTIFGNEITNTARITKMNMILAGDGHSGINMRDSLANPVDGKYDVVLANIPYSQKTKYGNLYDLPTRNGDSACVQHCIKAISATSDNGRMAIVVPEGFLFRKDLSKTREYLLKNCNLQSIISLPQGVFLPYTGVKTNIIYATKVNQRLSSKEKRSNYWYFEVKSDGYTLDNHRRKLDTESDFDIYQEYRKLDDDQKQEMLDIGFEVIPLEKVKENSFNLVGSRYREVYLGQSKWDLIELSQLFLSIKNGVNVKQVDSGGKYKVSRIETISNGKIDLSKTKWTSDDVKEENFLRNGDILLSHINSYAHLAKSALFYNIKEKVVHGTNLIRLVPDHNKINPIFASYVFKSKYFIEAAKLFAQKAVNQASIKISDLKSIKIPCPPLSLQNQIASEILNCQNIIDGAKAIIDNYKPIIRIKNDWKKVKLSDIAKINPKSINPSKVYGDNKFIYIDISAVENGTGIVNFEKLIIGEDAPSRARRCFDKGDILMSTVRPNLQAFAYVDFEPSNCVASTGFAVLSPQEVNGQFLYYVLFSDFISKQLENAMGKGMYPSVNKSDLENLDIPVPSIEVQNQIVEQIEAEQKLIEPSKQLIKVFTKKIEERTNELFE